MYSVSCEHVQVGYCQGMAFLVGLLLFYVSEEPAFQIFCRLLSLTGVCVAMCGGVHTGGWVGACV
jgi:hypothetical protein